MSEFDMMMGLAYGLQAVGAVVFYSVFLGRRKFPIFIQDTLVFVTYTILWFLYSANNYLLNILSFLMLNLLLTEINYENKVISKIVMVLFYTGLMCITEILVLYAIKFFSGNEYTLEKEEIALLAVISKIVLLISVVIINLTKSDFLKIIEGKQLGKFSLCMFFIIAILYKIADMTAHLKAQREDSVIMIVITIGLLFSVIMMFYEFCEHAIDQQKIKENNMMMQKMNNDIKNYEQMKNSYEQIKIIKHDLPKHMEIIENFAKQNNMQGILNYINDFSKNVEELINRADTGNAALNIIIDSKANKAAKQGTKFKWRVRCDIGFMQDADIASIFSNILDNALESCQRYGGGYIDIRVLSVNGNSITIYLENSCSEIKDMSDNIPKTIKKDTESHGYGMKSVQAVAAKYGGYVCCAYDEERKVFITEISIPMQL